MDAEYNKNELIEWLSKLEEPSVLYQIAKIKEASETDNETGFDFDKEWENGYTVEEFKEEMHKRIKAYPWKK